MKYGVVYYEETNNIGDDIQSYAAMRFLPHVDYFIDREKLDIFQPEEEELVSAIMNGWYMHNKCNWPPSSSIHPLYVSMHFTEYDHLGIGMRFLDGLGKDYLNKYAPIGCRDLETQKHLEEHGIGNYLSGCMTLTLPRQQGAAPENPYICLVDVPDEVEQAVRQKLAGTGIEIKIITHSVDYYRSPVALPERFERVKDLLCTFQYANCVITSRLHSALPCLALEAPVLLIFDEEKDEVERFDVFLNTLHHQTKREFLQNQSVYDIVNPPANKTDYLRFRNELIQRCEDFISEAGKSNKTAPGKEALSQELLEKVTWQKEILQEAEHGFTEKSDELKAYMNELEAGRQWLEGQYNNYKELAENLEKNANKAAKEIAEKNYEFDNALIEAEREKLNLEQKYNKLANTPVLEYFNIQEIFTFPFLNEVTEAEIECFDFTQKPGQPLQKRVGSGEAFLSIVSGYYNGAGLHIKETFNSIVSQTFPWFEWVIVNDGTTNEEDLQILEELAASDSRIRVIYQPNQGLSAARNTAIQNSKTDLIVIVDTDDLIEPNMLEIAYWTMQTNPQAAWCFFDSIGFHKDDYLWRKKFSSRKLKEDNFLVVCAIIRRTALQQVGGYRVEKETFYEDWSMWLSLLKENLMPVHVHQYGYWYRRKEGMLSDILSNTAKSDFAKKIIDEYAKDVPDNLVVKEFPVWEPGVVIEENESYAKWQPQIVSDKKSKNVLFLIADYKEGKTSEDFLSLAKKLLTKNIHSVFAAMLPGKLDMQQKFVRVAPDSFYLPGFLQIENYAAFLQYLISSRKIDAIVIGELASGFTVLEEIYSDTKEIPVVALVNSETSKQVLENISEKNALTYQQSGANLDDAENGYELKGSLEEAIAKLVFDEKYFDKVPLSPLDAKRRAEIAKDFLSAWQKVWVNNCLDEIVMGAPTKTSLLEDLRWNANKINELEGLVKQQDATIREHIKTFENQHYEFIKAQADIEKLHGELDQNQADIEKLHGELDQNQEEIEKLHGELDQNQEEIGKQHVELHEKYEKIKKQKEELLQKQEELENLNDIRRELEVRINERQKQIDRLNAFVNQLQNNFFIRMLIRIFRYKI